MDELETPSLKTGIAATAVLSIIALGLVYFFRPWFHTIIYGLLFVGPELLQLLILPPIVYLGILFWKGSDIAKYASVLVLCFVILGLLLGGAYSQIQMTENVEYENSNSLTEVNSETPRILPSAVSDQYAQNTLQYPQHHLSEGDITMIDGKPHWSYAAKPEGFVNSWRINQKGGVFIDMTTTQTDVKNIDNEMEVGRGMAFNRNYKWNAVKNNFWTEYKEPFMVPHNDKMYIAVPTVDHNHHIGNPLEGQIPIIYTTPEWSGVTLISEDGTVEQLSPEEAQSHEVLKGQRLYPFSLARYEVKSHQYNNGVINAWFIHDDQLELASTGDSNKQPFLMVNEDSSISYFTAVEPYGDSDGVYQIWTHNGRTGELERNTLDDKPSLVGPNRSRNYVEQAIPELRQDMRMVEPLPVVVDNSLYWQVRVIPDKASGIAYTAFVNAETTDVVVVTEDQQIYDFLSGDIEQTNIDDGEGQPSEETVTVVIVEDGEPVETVEIAKDSNWAVEVEKGNTTETEEDSTG
jgi:hypothetical protein